MVLVFGGAVHYSDSFADLLGWDGTNVKLLSPGGGPSKRRDAAMAFDIVRQRAVLFGGEPLSNDTWEWTGGSWVLRTPGAGPSARKLVAMAYDAARQVTLLYGGWNPSVGWNIDTWTWDGQSWRQLSPSTVPRVASPMAGYDGSRQRVVLIGTNAGNLTETWEWNGTDWQLVGPGPHAGGIAYSGLTYDSRRRRVVLFGGQFSGVPSNALWEWDGQAWTFLNPANPPDRRYSHVFCYHEGAQAALLWGGQSAHREEYGDGWTFDGNVWRSVVSAAPMRRTESPLAYDEIRSRVVLFGGASGAGPMDLDDTWEWDGRDWRRHMPSVVPPARSLHVLLFQPQRRRTLLFGGYSQSMRVALGDTWEWDGASWTRASGSVEPPARTFAMAAYDDQRQRVVVYGGRDSALGFLADTWEWDGQSWQQKFPASTPGPRSHAYMAYDSERRLTIMAGGWSSQGATSDTWSWDGTNWRQIAPMPNLYSTANHGLVHDPTRAKTFFFGGGMGANSLIHDQIVEFDGTTWRSRSVGGAIGVRSGHGVTLSKAGGRMIVFGGYRATNNTPPVIAPIVADTWELLFPVDSIGPGTNTGTPLTMTWQGEPLLGATMCCSTPSAQGLAAFVFSGGPRPVPAARFGAGVFCGTTLVYPDLGNPVVAVASGNPARFCFPIPLNTSLLDAILLGQGFVPGAGCLTATDGTVIRVFERW